MSGNGRRGGGDRVLESRHLIVLFLGVVLLCGVFFTLGYVMGRNQYDGAVHAAEAPPDMGAPEVRVAAKSPARDAAPAPAAAPANSEWDFYSKNSNNRLEPLAKPSAPSTAPSPAPTSNVNSDTATPAANAKAVPVSPRFQAPRMPKGSVVLQIAAVTHQTDALAMADALQQKKFPAFVVAPSGDNFYRVQVGPYRDQRNAEAARNALDRDGFKAIIKR